MRVALYARVSTAEQTSANQLVELRRYAEARGWTVVGEYVDDGISGTRESRPALDKMSADAKRRKFDAVACWRLDRLGRSLHHLILLLEEWRALGVAFISLAEGLDATTAGKLQLHVLAAISEFERARIAERVRAGMARAKAGNLAGVQKARSNRRRKYLIPGSRQQRREAVQSHFLLDAMEVRNDRARGKGLRKEHRRSTRARSRQVLALQPRDYTLVGRVLQQLRPGGGSGRRRGLGRIPHRGPRSSI